MTPSRRCLTISHAPSPRRVTVKAVTRLSHPPTVQPALIGQPWQPPPPLPTFGAAPDDAQADRLLRRKITSA